LPVNNKEWIEEVIKDETLRTGELNSFQDALFDNEMNALVNEARKHYEETSYKLALKAGHYDFLNARDSYREACNAAGIPLHKDLVLKYIRLQALVLTPIAPHWSEYIWREVLDEKSSVQFALFPEVPAADLALSAAREYVKTTASNVNSAEASQLKKMAKGKQSDFDPKKPKKLTIFITDSFPAWQTKYIDLLKEVWDPAKNSQKIDDKELNGRIGKMGEMKKAMPFVQTLKKRLRDGEPVDVVLARKLVFDEPKTLLVCFRAEHVVVVKNALTFPPGHDSRSEEDCRSRVGRRHCGARREQAGQRPDERWEGGRCHYPCGRVGAPGTT